MKRILTGCLSLALSLSALHADMVDDWNATLLQCIRTASTNPPKASRLMAMVHLSIFDAVNGIELTHRPYIAHEAAPAGASVEAAACAAAETVLAGFYSENAAVAAAISTAYETTLAAVPDGQAKNDGILWGETCANTMMTLRASDRSDVDVPYTPDANVPGKWRPTGPANAPALLPQWGHMTPFALPRGDFFRPQPPPAITGSAYAYEVNLVKAIGGTTSIRNADQDEIAFFWEDGRGTETPPGHWLHIAQDVAEDQDLSMSEKARLYALISMAVADAAIVAWDAKYAYDLWRPVTAIREADTDGNPETEADPTWTNFIPTPPFPEYTSGHSTFSRSSATVLAAFFGTDSIPFTTGSDAMPGIMRSYPGFSAAADDAGISRIYGGIHYPSANIAGQASGFQVGTLVASRFLLPFDALEFTVVRLAGDGLELSANVTVGSTYDIEASSDLESWESLGTITAGAPTISWLDPNAPSGKRYYRVRVRN